MPSETDTKSVTDDLNNKFILMIKTNCTFLWTRVKLPASFIPSFRILLGKKLQVEQK